LFIAFLSLFFYQSILQYRLFPWMFDSENRPLTSKIETIIIDGETPTELRIENTFIIKKVWNVKETRIHELHVKLPIYGHDDSKIDNYYHAVIRHGDNIEEIISRWLFTAYPLYRKELDFFNQYTISPKPNLFKAPFTDYMFLTPKIKNSIIIKCARGDEINRLCDLLHQTSPHKLLVSIWIPRTNIEDYQKIIELADARITSWALPKSR
jgi:hypothetical protein